MQAQPCTCARGPASAARTPLAKKHGPDDPTAPDGIKPPRRNREAPPKTGDVPFGQVPSAGLGFLIDVRADTTGREASAPRAAARRVIWPLITPSCPAVVTQGWQLGVRSGTDDPCLSCGPFLYCFCSSRSCLGGRIIARCPPMPISAHPTGFRRNPRKALRPWFPFPNLSRNRPSSVARPCPDHHARPT